MDQRGVNNNIRSGGLPLKGYELHGLNMCVVYVDSQLSLPKLQHHQPLNKQLQHISGRLR